MSDEIEKALDAARARAARRREESAARFEGMEIAQTYLIDPSTLPKTDPRWASPLMEAAGSQDLESVRAWLASGVDPNETDRLGKAALHEAVRDAYRNEANGLEIVKSLLAAGANLNAQEKDGTTPLMYATWHGSYKLVKSLIDLGADVHLNAKDRKTVLASIKAAPALARKSKRTIKVLIDAGAIG